METGQLIIKLRLKKGMTQADLAAKAEVSAKTIDQIESGKIDPNDDTLQMIAKALGIDFSLFAETESDKKEEFKKFNDNNWSAMLHLSGVLPLIIPTLIIWNQKKNKTKLMSNHFRASISLQISILGIILGGLLIYLRGYAPTIMIVVLLAGGLVSILNAINVMNGKPYINPFIKIDDVI